MGRGGWIAALCIRLSQVRRQGQPPSPVRRTPPSREPERAGWGVRQPQASTAVTTRRNGAWGRLAATALIAFSVLSLTAAKGDGCHSSTGPLPDGRDGPRPVVTAMKHQPTVYGHIGKVKYVKSRECWAIWYHSPYTGKVIKTCTEYKTYRKYHVGMEYHG